jgi:hypothetical protein
MALLIGFGGLDKQRIMEALRLTFERRGTPDLPASLVPPPADWQVPFHALAEECGLPTDVAGVFAGVQKFVEEVPSIAYQRGVAPNERPSPAQSVKHDKPSGSRGRRNPNTCWPALLWRPIKSQFYGKTADIRAYVYARRFAGQDGVLRPNRMFGALGTFIRFCGATLVTE